MSTHSALQSTSKRLDDLSKSDEEEEDCSQHLPDINTIQSTKTNKEQLRNSIIDLYLDVKIRSSDEIDRYDTNQYDKEREKLDKLSLINIIEYIKASIEILMNMKLDENEQKSIKDHRPSSKPYFK